MPVQLKLCVPFGVLRGVYGGESASGTIFAYGQTGTGKTHTVRVPSPPQQQGMLDPISHGSSLTIWMRAQRPCVGVLH